MNPLVSYTLITQNRKQHLKDALDSILRQDYEPIEIIVVDNASTDGTCELIEEFANPRIRYVRLHENLGVSGGRNVAIRQARGEVLITLDDDAVIEGSDATSRVVSRLAEDSTLGALAFFVVNHYSGEMDKNYFPSRNKQRDPDEEFETYGFVGVGHAIPRIVHDKIGLYNDYFPYGHEEGDLSLRMIDAGFRILYFPQVTVRHKLQTTRREKLSRRWPIVLENRIKVAIRNLPWRYVATTAGAWSLRTLWDCRGNPLPLIQAFTALWRKRKSLGSERKPISKNTVNRLRDLGGPLYY